MIRSRNDTVLSGTFATSQSVILDMSLIDGLSVQANYSNATPGAETFTVKTQASGQLTITAHGLVTGTVGQVSNSGGALPTGLSALTNYYVIVIDINTIALATSLSNAQAGTAVVLSSNGTGTQTFTPTTSASNTFKIQTSNDKVKWQDFNTTNNKAFNATVTIATSTGSVEWDIGKPNCAYVNLVYTPSAGQITLAVIISANSTRA